MRRFKTRKNEVPPVSIKNYSTPSLRLHLRITLFLLACLLVIFEITYDHYGLISTWSMNNENKDFGFVYQEDAINNNSIHELVNRDNAVHNSTHEIVNQENTKNNSRNHTAIHEVHEGKQFGLLSSSKTGSYANCTSLTNPPPTIESPHFTSDQFYYMGNMQISCQTISFRMSKQSFANHTSINSKIIVGVLSSASEGRYKRDYIRKTWAKKYSYNVFFVVAGPWNESIQNETDTHKDMIWIDAEEVYDGEKSVLTLKTYSFISIVDLMMKKLNSTIQYTHIFKTDDDSYVDINALETELEQNQSNYIGHCQLEQTKVVRDGAYKWPLSVESYPDEYLPKYCQGAGYALSRAFISCANEKSQYSNSHLATARFMPFEDVAVGILAERCGYNPSNTQTGEIKLTRYDSMEAKRRTSKGDKRTDNLVPITACMTGRIVQHRVINEFDMQELHKTVLDKSYCKVTRRKRGRVIEDLEARGIEWFG